MKVENPKQYVGRMAPEVAKELGMDIDDFLDEIHGKGYYYCAKCGEIKEISEMQYNLEQHCHKCISKEIIDAYVDGVCPDCQEDIPADVCEGYGCKNCGHAFFLDDSDEKVNGCYAE